jgi:uncharacterized membrane protein YhhN
MAAFSVIFVTPFLFARHNPRLPVWGYIFAQFFFTLAVSWLAGLVMRSFNKPALYGQIPLIILAVVELIVQVTHFPTYDLAALDTYNIQKVTPSSIAAALIALKALSTILPLTVIMIRQAIKTPASRSRSILIAAGLLLVFIGGPMHDLVGPKLFVVADIVVILGSVVLLGGLLVEPKSAATTAAQPVATA